MLATKSNSYTFLKDGVWYFSRRVPADLRGTIERVGLLTL